MDIMKVKHASFSYDGTTVLNDVNFDVSEGDYLCIVGENGSGKSTLIKGLLRMKSPDSGSIEYSGELTKKDIGYLSQSTQVQKDFPASVQEVVLSGLLSTGKNPFYSGRQKEISRDKMKQLGILEMRKRCFRDLSGGQRQRVLLARALCASSKLIIMDEPIAGLDPVIAADMYKTIKKLNSDEGLTVIMVSHDIDNSIKHAKNILHLENRQMFWGPSSDYIKSPVGRAYMERG